MRKHLLLGFATLALLASAYASTRAVRRGDDVRVPVPSTVDFRELTGPSSVAPEDVPPSASAPHSPPPAAPVTAPPYLSPSEPPAPVAPVPSSIPATASASASAPEVNIASTFYPQAPDADWSMPWQEACEEASILLVVNTYQDHGWARAEFKQHILNLVDWEVATFGSYEHTDQEQMVRILREVYGLEAVIHDDPSLELVRELLGRGHLLIGTFSGKELGNPYYSNGGPVYHAMVLKGVTASGRIVTNDVGTKRGADYTYRWSTIQGALRDYAEPITAGQKRLIEVLPP